MSKETIIERILSDAEAEANAIVAEATARAEEITAAALARAEKERAETEAELSQTTAHILGVNAATARLDGAKVLLAEKRRVIDAIYALAAEKLAVLSERESLLFFEKLLKENAEEGDEIVFDEGFAFRESAARLPVVKELKLTIAPKCEKLGGGCMLRGKRCDKDLSYAALLRADMEANQSALAAKLFARL